MASLSSDIQTTGAQRTWLQNWLLASLMTGVTVVCARFAEFIPHTPVPFTLQVFAVLLTGLLLGRRWSVVAQLQYLALGAVGLPVFARGGVGFASLLAVTGGYLLSYPVAAGLVGWIAGGSGATGATLPRQMAACAVGLAVIYGFGCVWFAAVVHKPLFAVVLPGALIFFAWDSVKAAVAIAVARGISVRQKPAGD